MDKLGTKVAVAVAEAAKSVLAKHGISDGGGDLSKEIGEAAVGPLLEVLRDHEDPSITCPNCEGPHDQPDRCNWCSSCEADHNRQLDDAEESIWDVE